MIEKAEFAIGNALRRLIHSAGTTTRSIYHA
jgi:hypothetical protein